MIKIQWRPQNLTETKYEKGKKKQRKANLQDVNKFLKEKSLFPQYLLTHTICDKTNKHEITKILTEKTKEMYFTDLLLQRAKNFKTSEYTATKKVNAN
jgi:hypothetical protein